jgi:predicted  nucleic acid-binding Zn-ribbon protein
LDLKLSDLPQWFEQKSGELLRTFRQEARTILDETTRQVRTLRQAGRELAERAGQSDPDGRYAERLSEKLLGALGEIELPEQLTYERASTIYDELLRAVGTVTEAGRVYVPRLGSTFKSQIVELDFTLKRLAGNVDKLNSTLVKNRALAQQIDAVSRRVQKVLDDVATQANVKSRMDEVVQRISKTQRDMETAKTAGKRLQEETWFKDVAKAGKSVEETEAKILRFFGHLSKPLRKMQRMSHDGQIGLMESYRRVLDELVEAPVEFLSRSELLDLNPIFEKMHELLRTGKLKVEPRKERRAREAVKQFQDGMLEKLRGEYAQVVGELQALEKRLNEMGLGEKLDLLHKSSKRMESELEKLRHEQADLERRIGELQKGIQEGIREIESTLSKLFGGEYSIRRD